ncbi:MAG: aminoacyl-tRNA hydrolase [Rhodobacteraceae bacterium]|nr:aminoacyl-tRNA hydrolase [Paracoccaceae bacterium]MCY4195515.1 aminoacyl-tRNA hydrolase [Paracoccaceae bacterium]MCY4327969.1 aminoacyl-tRNA hydrolase [Paracoccaceae bacterium]
MKLIIGLGNPGQQYEGHRHNIGFMAVDRIASDHTMGPWRARFNGLMIVGQIETHRVMLLKPQTYMNNSGQSARAAMDYYKLTATNVVVLHDELDLNPGQLRTKTGGGTAGHRGLQSLQSHLGNEFSRIRIGIGHPGRKELVNRYVLHDFAGEETAGFDNLLMAISKSALYLAAGDFAKFTSAVAQHRNSPSHTDTGIVQPAPPPEKRTATSLIAQLAQRFGR